MQVDIIGIDDVLRYIEATKLSKFTVQRSSGAGYIPCFECIDSETNANAVNEFRKWAEIVKNNMAYKLNCFDIAEVIIDANGNEKLKKSNKRSGKMECTFVLNQGHQNSFAGNKNEQVEHQHFDMADFRKQVIKEIAEQTEKNEILAELKSMKLEIAELRQLDNLEEEEEVSKIAGIPTDQITQIMGLVNMFRPNQQPPVINGVEEVADFTDLDIKKANINKAIKILYKYDPNLDTDLLKLSNLAETKTETFNMLITTLRSM
jgi:hypothetical protein